MIVKIPRLSGFCPGVKNAENRIFAKLETEPSGEHSVLGMMINNRKYIEYLASNRIKTIEDKNILKNGSTVFIRTHGIDRRLQASLSADYKLIDLTCRNVKRVQEIILEHSDKGAVVIITGKKSHPEVIGLKSYGRHSLVIEKEEELDKFITNPNIDGKEFRPSIYSEVFITSQTTGSRKLFEDAIKKISHRWPEVTVDSFNSICPVTEKKEEEALKLQQNTDISFVIGDQLSSNASKLYKRLKDADSQTWFIQDAVELKKLDIDLSIYTSALVVSSASTPEFVEKEVVEYLKSIKKPTETAG